MAGTADRPEQRIVRRNPWFVVVPSILLVVLLMILVWEIVLANLSAEQKAAMPFHATLLGISPAASASGLFAGLLLARGQFARSVRPVIGWTGDWTRTDAGGEQQWVVSIHNGGSGLGTIRQTEYRVTAAGSDPVAMPWLDLESARDRLDEIGMVPGRQFTLIQLGVGHPLVSSTKPKDGYPMFTIAESALDLVHALDMRVSVVDIVGDRHQRYLELLRGARSELIPTVQPGRAQTDSTPAISNEAPPPPTPAS